jgi:hypothetical protein
VNLVLFNVNFAQKFNQEAKELLIYSDRAKNRAESKLKRVDF